MYSLVIAEKPSVAQAIAKVLHSSERQDGYLKGDSHLVSWCVGHLVELAEPENYDGKYEIWKKEDLPIFPTNWEYQVSSQTKKQYQILKDLMSRDDVDTVINACDAGREGELIFRLVYEKAKCKKHMKRLWISSLEDEAIKKGFETLEEGSKYDKLYEAALCRERADWIVGINATRFFSTAYGPTLNVGRVMTPTLALTVEREKQIRSFQVEDIYTVQLGTTSGTLASAKFKDVEKAQKLLKACLEKGTLTITKAEKKQKQEKAPALFDLTSLQREANKKLGFTAQQTLDYTQALYEKKLVSYPRTDSRYLTEDMEAGLPNLIKKAKIVCGLEPTLMVNYKQVINGKKVTDHHAIVPTSVADEANLDDLPGGEREVLKLIALRLLEAVSGACVFIEAVLEAELEGEKFTAKGKQIIDSGWKSVKKEPEKEGDNSDSVLRLKGNEKPGDTLRIDTGNIKGGKTTPPKFYTEDTLLSAMENAGKEETPDEAERKGLGTPATRAGIIEKLVRIGFLERTGDKKTKYLVPTHKGEALISVIPETIRSASMTAEWEQKLLQVERENYGAEKFMGEIEDLIRNLIDTYEVVTDAEVFTRPVYAPIGKCPHCGGDVVEKTKGFFCSNKECKFALWKDNRFFDSIGKKMNREVAEDLLHGGSASLKKCKSQRSGKIFDATLLLTTDEKGQAQFALQFEKKK